MQWLGGSRGTNDIKSASASFLANWLFILYSMRVFEFLGILVVIISKMLVRLVPFLTLQFLVLFIFSMVATISFF